MCATLPLQRSFHVKVKIRLLSHASVLRFRTIPPPPSGKPEPPVVKPCGCQNFLIAKYLINTITWIKCLSQAPPGDRRGRRLSGSILLSVQLIHPTTHPPPTCQQSEAHVKKAVLVAHTHRAFELGRVQRVDTRGEADSSRWSRRELSAVLARSGG